MDSPRWKIYPHLNYDSPLKVVVHYTTTVLRILSSSKVISVADLIPETFLAFHLAWNFLELPNEEK